MKNFFKLDWVLMIAVTLLVVIGLTALYSVSSVGDTLNLDHFKKQIVAAIIGFGLLFFFASFDYRVLLDYSTKLYFTAIAILLAVFLLGTTIRGTTGWIGFGNFNFQPVEIVKLVIVIFLASFLSKKKTEFGISKRLFVSFILVSIPIFLIIKQPDFGSAAIIIFTWLSMIVMAGIDKKNILILVSIALIGVFAGSLVIKDYQKERLINFVNPEQDSQGSGYNVLQSIVAVGSGGWIGKGLGHGSQSQLNFLPEKHTDFIFAVIAEELGLFGAGIVLTLFGVVFYRIKETARLSRDNFGYLTVIGIICALFVQMFVNIGMNMGVAPVAGVPLPFVSYGGSSLIAVLASIGIIQSIYIRRLKTF